MGRIVVTEYVSLDGVIEGPGGGEHPDKKPLRLVDSKAVGPGIAVLTYEPVWVGRV